MNKESVPEIIEQTRRMPLADAVGFLRSFFAKRGDQDDDEELEGLRKLCIDLGSTDRELNKLAAKSSTGQSAAPKP